MYTYIRVYEHIICFASTYVPYIDHIHYGSKLGVHRCRDYVDPIYPYWPPYSNLKNLFLTEP